MPGQRIPKVAAALLAVTAMTAAPLDIGDDTTTAKESFVEILDLHALPLDQAEIGTQNAGCSEC